MLMNIGPTKEGKIIPIFQERLQQMGKWLNVTGEAVYSSVPWKYQNDTLSTGVWSVDTFKSLLLPYSDLLNLKLLEKFVGKSSLARLAINLLLRTCEMYCFG